MPGAKSPLVQQFGSRDIKEIGFGFRTGRYSAGTRSQPAIRCEYTFKEKSRITVGAIMALVIVGWLLVLATAFLSVR
jgi:hypothetical protein